MFSLEESKVLIEFLDRVTITGHQERVNMNIIIDKLINTGKRQADAEGECNEDS